MKKQEEVFELDFLGEVLSKEEAFGLLKIQRNFLESYALSKDKMSVEEWLPQELKKQLPERTFEEIQEISTEIITSLQITEKMKRSQQKAIESGRSKESWLESQLMRSTSHMSVQESVKYLQILDDSIKNANAKMHETITTKGSGYFVPSRNPNLDGFIAEQHHVNSFNMDAAVKKSDLRAEVQPLKQGETYTKNGFDVVIKDSNGKRIHQYQMKYGATAEDTIRMLKSGNYNNQVIVVPEEQVEAVQKAFPNKTVSSTIGHEDIKSKPLTKEEAKELQKKAQTENFMDLSWNDYEVKDIALGIGREAGRSGLQSAAVGAGISIVAKTWKGEPIDGKETIEKAIVSGADSGVKAAMAGALKVASEKEVLKILPKGTSGSTFANIAFVGIENIKIFGKVAIGKLTIKEGIEEMEKTTGACVAGIALSTKTAAIGAIVGSVLGPIGVSLGGLIGSGVGYMIGLKVGQTIIESAQKVRNGAIKIIKTGLNHIADGFNYVKEKVCNSFS